MNQNSAVNQAFSSQSSYFDEIEVNNPILIWMRSQIRKHVISVLKKPAKILELNSGTGLDAIYFANQGHSVLATDLSDGMIQQIRQKVAAQKLKDKIEVKQLSYDALNLDSDQKFDFIFSNFGGLNCIEDLTKVTLQLNSHLNSNAYLTFVIMPQICPWELLYSLRFSFKFAFRRFGLSYGNIGGIKFRTYYHSVRDVKKALGEQFDLIDLRALAGFSFPPFMDKYAVNFPKLYQILCKFDERFGSFFPFNRLCDHYILTARFKG